MAKVSAEEAKTTLVKLQGFARLERKATDEVGWIMFGMGVGRKRAETLIKAARNLEAQDIEATPKHAVPMPAVSRHTEPLLPGVTVGGLPAQRRGWSQSEVPLVFTFKGALTYYPDPTDVGTVRTIETKITIEAPDAATAEAMVNGVAGLTMTRVG